MAKTAVRSLQRIARLGRLLAVSAAAVAGAQVYARGHGATAGVLTGLVVGGVLLALLGVALVRFSRWADSVETEEPRLPPPRPRAPKRSRRVLTGDREDAP